LSFKSISVSEARTGGLTTDCQCFDLVRIGHWLIDRQNVA